MTYVTISPQDPLGYEQKVVSTAAVGLAVPTTGVNYAHITVVGAGVRFRDDGVDPTATVGKPLAASAEMEYPGNPGKLRFIRSGAADATLEVLYYNA